MCNISSWNSIKDSKDKESKVIAATEVELVKEAAKKQDQGMRIMARMHVVESLDVSTAFPHSGRENR
jgi:hypothetical protein